MPVRIGLVFTVAKPGAADWPYLNYDYVSRIKELLPKITEAFPQVEFVPLVTWDEKGEFQKVEEFEASPWSPQLTAGLPTDVDGYVLYLLTEWAGQAGINSVLEKKKPTVMVDDIFGGTGNFLVYYPRARREGYPVIGVAPSNFSDALHAISLLVGVLRVKGSVILDVTDRDVAKGWADGLSSLGVTVKTVPSGEVAQEFGGVSDDEARPFYEKWVGGAYALKRVKEEDIMRSAKLHVALMKLAKKYGADAVAVDCWPLVAESERLPAYPCLSLTEMDNEGMVGTCEADLGAALTQLVIRRLMDRPSFTSDPVIDTSKNEIVYAHCRGPWKVFGKNGPSNPYVLRDHDETQKGVAVQSLMPLGEKVTTCRFCPETKTLLIHSGVAVENINIENERACRTKLGVKTDAYAIMENYYRFPCTYYCWHRVTVYGDYRRDLEDAAALLGFKVYEEDIKYPMNA